MDFERKEEEKKQNELGNRKEQAEKWADLMGWLQLYVGESQIDRIVDLFVRQEEENFALFTYINELNSEVRVCVFTHSNPEHIEFIKNGLSCFRIVESVLDLKERIKIRDYNLEFKW